MSKKKIVDTPMCWKCASKITKGNGDGSLGLVGCKENKDIKTYSDAEKLCPLIYPPCKSNIIIMKEDVHNELHPYLWESWLDDNNLSKNTTQLTVKVIASE